MANYYVDNCHSLYNVMSDGHSNHTNRRCSLATKIILAKAVVKTMATSSLGIITSLLSMKQYSYLIG